MNVQMFKRSHPQIKMTKMVMLCLLNYMVKKQVSVKLKTRIGKRGKTMLEKEGSTWIFGKDWRDPERWGS